MCDSLSKKNFDKIGLLAIVFKTQMLANSGIPLTESSQAKLTLSAIEQAEKSDLLKLSRVECEHLALTAKGKHTNWGSFANLTKENRPGFIKYLKEAITK